MRDRTASCAPRCATSPTRTRTRCWRWWPRWTRREHENVGPLAARGELHLRHPRRAWASPQGDGGNRPRRAAARHREDRRAGRGAAEAGQATPDEWRRCASTRTSDFTMIRSIPFLDTRRRSCCRTRSGGMARAIRATWRRTRSALVSPRIFAVVVTPGTRSQRPAVPQGAGRRSANRHPGGSGAAPTHRHPRGGGGRVLDIGEEAWSASSWRWPSAS